MQINIFKILIKIKNGDSIYNKQIYICISKNILKNSKFK
jgi:hypothetical protein